MNIWKAVERAGMKESVITPEQWERIATMRNELGTRSIEHFDGEVTRGPLALRSNGTYSLCASGTIQYGSLMHAPLTRRSILYGLTSIDDE